MVIPSENSEMSKINNLKKYNLLFSKNKNIIPKINMHNINNIKKYLVDKRCNNKNIVK
jgi:hypothetical protein